MTFRTNFKWDQPTRAEEALKRASEQQRHQADVYRAVDIRDGYRCRCCGVRTDPYAVSLVRGEHHHVVYRSAGGATSTANVALICARCHADEHRHRLKIDGNADDALTFFRRDERGEYYVSKHELAVRITERD